MTIWTKQCQKQQICGRSWAFYHSLCLSMIRASNLPQIDFPSNLIQTLHPICRRFFVPSSLSRKCSKAARTAAWESVWLVPVRPSTDLNMSGLVIGVFEHIATYCLYLLLEKDDFQRRTRCLYRHRWSLESWPTYVYCVVNLGHLGPKPGPDPHFWT